MKKHIEPIRIEIPARRKTRAHFVLFAENTPFKPKVVENKRNAYVRRPKHPLRSNED